ncbi:MAG: hypothetical protein V3571_09845, partial [Pseudodesulfovibrio sp.]
MKRLLHLVPVLILAFTVCCLPGCSSAPDGKEPGKAATGHPAQPSKKRYLAFGGGPTGGTFNFFANKIASIISGQSAGLDIAPRGSGGSAENLRTLNQNGVDMGIVYAGDAFLGRGGELPGDPARYDKVRA